MATWMRRADEYFSAPWALVIYQPILYLFLFGATIRLWVNDSEPPEFKAFIAEHFYGIWLILGVCSPLLAALAWFLIMRRSGRKRFLGMWLRLASDIGVATVLLSYHAVTSWLAPAETEQAIFSRYMCGAALVFVASLIIRDVWTLVVTERLAGLIHKAAR